MNITKKWNRFATVSCSHGPYIDPVAKESVIKFIKDFDPHLVTHLGDFTDLSPMMGGGNGHGDPLEPDIEQGLAFLEELKHKNLVILEGNHETRLRRLSHSSNEIVSECARLLLEQIENKAKKLKAEYIPYTGVWQGHRIGNALQTHGSIFNENACRDMAEMYCKDGVSMVIFGHTHAPGIAMGRRDDNPIGINVGTLTRRACMDYANARRKTFSWGQAICYGEYSDTVCMPNLYIHPASVGSEPWRILS